MSSLLNLGMMGKVAADQSDSENSYRALVCLFLSGGNDSFNMLAPVSGEARSDYESSRGAVAIPVSQLLALPEPLPDGRELGIHEKMPEIHGLLNQGKAALVSNVGSLIEPTTKSAYDDGTARIPLGLFSHSDQSVHWQSTLPDQRSPQSGWGGRLADRLAALNGVSNVSMNVSLSGLNIFQSGGDSAALAISSSGTLALQDWDNPSFLHRRQAAEAILDAEYQNAFERTFVNLRKGAIVAASEFTEALATQSDLGDFFSDNDLSQRLRTVARTIASRGPLNKNRQTFFVEFGGWDLHGSSAGHPALLEQLSKSIGEFQAAMAFLETEENVTLFTGSDFGRTLTPNQTGTDHAWGGNQLVVGGAVSGGQFFGDYPDLALNTNLDAGRGRLIPTTSVDEYYGDLALWMGVPPSDLGYVLPSLHRFWDSAGGGSPLGIFSVE
ncbi:DUF1501 domain-containing protein [Akkermansiaceae bacterium]|nr:DUF1501 domain-containing protein [Akkermansiaceae bacterium]